MIMTTLGIVIVVCGPLVGIDCGDMQLNTLRRYRETGNYKQVEKICKAYRRWSKESGPDARFEKECKQ